MMGTRLHENDLPRTTDLTEESSKRPMDPGHELAAAIMALLARSLGGPTFPLVCLICIGNALDGPVYSPAQSFRDVPFR